MPRDEDCVDHEDFKALSARLEYLHSEAKSFRSEASNIMHALDKRLSHLEYETEKTEERLGQGAQTMTRLGDQIERVNGKIDLPWWKLVGFVVPAIVAVLSVVWQMARNPSGEEFEQLKRQLWDTQTHVIRLEDKVDALLKRP